MSAPPELPERAALYTVAGEDAEDQLAWHSGKPNSPEAAILDDLRWMLLPELGVARQPSDIIREACPLLVQSWVRDAVPASWATRMAENLTSKFVDRFQADWGNPNGGDDGLTPEWRVDAAQAMEGWVHAQVAHGRVWQLVRGTAREYSADEVEAIVREQAPDLLEPSEAVAGNDALSRWLALHGVSQARCGLALGVTQTAVSDWVRGRKSPQSRYRAALERWSSGAIPANSWLSATERAELNRLEWLQPFQPRDRMPAGESVATQNGTKGEET